MEIILDMREKKLHEACMSLIQTNEKINDFFYNSIKRLSVAQASKHTKS